MTMLKKSYGGDNLSAPQVSPSAVTPGCQKTITAICQSFAKITLVYPGKSKFKFSKYYLKDPAQLARYGFEMSQAKNIFDFIIFILAYGELVATDNKLTATDSQLTADECEMISYICMNNKSVSIRDYAQIKNREITAVNREWQNTLKKLTGMVNRECDNSRILLSDNN